MSGLLIAGAGITGLTAALSLHAAGIECTRRLIPAGVGINLQPHAVRELTELGLGEELGSAYKSTTSTDVAVLNERASWTPPRTEVREFGAE